MAGFPKSTKALLLAVLASSFEVVHSTPVNFDAATTTITPCATVKCTSTTTCAVIGGKARCVPIFTPLPSTIPGVIKCGATVCEAGLTCCNPSCGVCVKPGMMCTQQVCASADALPLDTTTTTTTETTRSILPDPVVPIVKCGAAVCKPGLECCNASCGTCVEPGKGCTKQLCLPTVPVGEQQCGSNVCAKGHFCCNRSCGICAPIDGACTQQFCG